MQLIFDKAEVNVIEIGELKCYEKEDITICMQCYTMYFRIWLWNAERE